MNNQWYTAKCVFYSQYSGQATPVDPETLFENRYFLVRAIDEASAIERSSVLARSREHSYLNEYGTTVSWVFKSVADVKEILDRDFKEGTEVYYEYVAHI